VIKVLNELGVPAEFQGRNDIVVDGKKISGNAQAWHKNKMLHHGTILFDADLAFVANVLNVKLDKIQSKGIKSNRVRVTNIKNYLKEKITINELKLKLLTSFIESKSIMENNHQLTNSDMKRIYELQESKYRNWEWNYGESPYSQIFKEKRYEAGNIQVYFNLINGRIHNLKLFGDFLDIGNINPILDSLNGAIYNENICRAALHKINLDKILFNVSIDNLIDCLF
jgi:lipoate-protein ligase A